MPNPKKPRPKCLNCNKEPARSYYKYCSNSCQVAFQYKSYIANWKIGKISGLSGLGTVSLHIKRYLRDKYGNKCSLCGWSRCNVKTGQVPLVADHINGNWRDNTENNLRLICPNCDSLSPTYAALNKGNGRENRSTSRRVQEARVFVKQAALAQLVERRYRKP